MNANTKILIGILVLIIIFGAYYVTTQKNTATTQEETTISSEASPPTETQTTGETVTTKNTVTVAIGTDMDTPDPHAQTTTTIQGLVRHVYETLVWYDENGSIIPWLAESWEVSDDGLTYTFHLRKNVYFTDGAELDAYTVKTNVDRWLDPNAKVPLRSQLGPLKGAEVVDKYTVKLYLDKPYAPFLQAVANYLLIASPNVLEKYGNQTITDIKDAVGTGPFMFTEWEQGQKIVMTANHDYWGEKPKIKTIVWKIIPEAGTREAALLSGDVDVVLYPPPSDVPNLKNNPKIKLYTPLTNRIIFVALHPEGPLADPKVRQALNYAVDKEAIVENVLFGLGVPADSPVPPHFVGHFTMTPPYNYDPEKAKQLLSEAGYPNGFKLVFLHPTGRYLQDKQVAEAIQAYLQQIGVEVELRTADWPTFVKSILQPLNQTDFDMLLIGWGPNINDAHFTLYPQFHSSQMVPNGLGLSYYNNSVVDRLLEQALSETNQTKRMELYKEAEEIIWKDAPWIFLYTQANLLVTSSDLQGLQMHPGGEEFFLWNAYFNETQ